MSLSNRDYMRSRDATPRDDRGGAGATRNWRWFGWRWAVTLVLLLAMIVGAVFSAF